MKRTILIPVSVAICLAACWNGDTTVARFNGGQLGSDQFAVRYRQYLENTGQRDNILLRQEILNNMVNEELILAELERSGFSELPESREFLERTKTQALLDRYARYSSMDTMQVTERDYQAEFRAYNTKATARYLYASTESGAWALKRRLDQGATFPELARECFRDPGLATNGGFLGTFGYGDLEPQLEQLAFTLPIGAVSDPFPMRVGYGLLKVESRQLNPLLNESDFARVKQELHHTIIHRKSAVSLAFLSEQIILSLDPVFRPEAVTKLFNSWEGIVSQATESRMTAMTGEPLVSFEGGEWSIGQFIQKVRMTSDRQRRRVQTEKDLQDVTIGLLVRDELIRRASEAGLQEDPEVLEQVRLSYLNHRLTSWRAAIGAQAADAIDEETLRREFQARPELHVHPPEVNVAEVLVRTREEADAIATRARNGAVFSDLARSHSIRLWAAEQGGELGFGGMAEFGPLGARFLDAPVGAVIGPESVDPYFGVFKIIAKRPGEPRSFDDAREEVRSSLVAGKTQEAIAGALRRLRSEAGVSIDMDALANVQIDHHAGDQES
ncbi:MAG: peptidylprolyl isomerase [Ignavibacteria bacterium]|nr:peptidylprolyl isomerase [Ignavibacteria bacterium]